MKYFLAILAVLFVLGCVAPQNQNSSNSKRTSKSNSAIYDEEFDLLVAPEYDYESDVPYADQIRTTTTIKSTTTYTSESKTTKPAKHPVSAN